MVFEAMLLANIHSLHSLRHPLHYATASASFATSGLSHSGVRALVFVGHRHHLCLADSVALRTLPFSRTPTPLRYVSVLVHRTWRLCFGSQWARTPLLTLAGRTPLHYATLSAPLRSFLCFITFISYLPQPHIYMLFRCAPQHIYLLPTRSKNHAKIHRAHPPDGLVTLFAPALPDRRLSHKIAGQIPPMQDCKPQYIFLY
jgi:hypothetical protein